MLLPTLIWLTSWKVIFCFSILDMKRCSAMNSRFEHIYPRITGDWSADAVRILLIWEERRKGVIENGNNTISKRSGLIW